MVELYIPEPVGPTKRTLLLSIVGASSTGDDSVLASVELLSLVEAFSDGGLIHPRRCHVELAKYCGTTETRTPLDTSQHKFST
jgi:hypothetical protein